MITVIRQDAAPEPLERLVRWLQEKGLQVHISQGLTHTVLGLVGDTTCVDPALLRSMDIVESVRPITEPFLRSSRRNHPDSSSVKIGDREIGNGHFCLIAGPCAVESEEQLLRIAMRVKEAGADLLRGGAFKPRTSPYAFQGLGTEALRMLSKAKKLTGLPLVSELTAISQLDDFADIDVIQVGARNMQNFEMLKELGRCRRPVLLKRGIGCTLNELLLSAEYLLSSGNEQVILCERGIRSFDTYSRNTMDLCAIPALHELSHLPVIADPSHATGRATLTPPMALAAAACGADGIMLEVHDDPMHALCDGAQALLPDTFSALAQKIRAVRAAAL